MGSHPALRGHLCVQGCLVQSGLNTGHLAEGMLDLPGFNLCSSGGWRKGS